MAINLTSNKSSQDHNTSTLQIISTIFDFPVWCLQCKCTIKGDKCSLTVTLIFVRPSVLCSCLCVCFNAHRRFRICVCIKHHIYGDTTRTSVQNWTSQRNCTYDPWLYIIHLIMRLLIPIDIDVVSPLLDFIPYSVWPRLFFAWSPFFMY